MTSVNKQSLGKTEALLASVCASETHFTNL